MKVETWRQFAEITIQTNDLDPTYVFLHAAMRDKGEDWATKFAIHYLCFYDLGGAVTTADSCSQEGFWEFVAAHFHQFRRGTERRHSRGDIGQSYITNLASKGTPAEIWPWMYATTYQGLVEVFKKHFVGCGFGPYFLWKVLDFQERIWERPIKLTLKEAVKNCPDDPRKCAAILWPGVEFQDVMEFVTEYISQFKAPPSYNRQCSYQEAETILCMLKGYFITKTHTIGDDIESKYEQLKNKPEYHQYLPPRQNWAQYERATLVP
jgi:hypothetical protein